MTLSSAAALSKDRSSAPRLRVFQHRHFAAIAGMIASFGYPQERERLVLHFANTLARSNVNFDRARFLRACGVAS